MFHDDVDRVIVAATETCWRFPVEDHVLVVRAGSSAFLLLNSTAQLLWEVYAETGSEAACADALVDAFGIDAERAAGDVATMIAAWRASGIFEVGAVLPDDIAPPCVVQQALHWQHYRVGGYAFSVGLEDGPLREDLSLRIARFAITEAELGAPRYTALAAGAHWVVHRDGALVDTGATAYAARVVLLDDVLHAAYGGAPWCANLHAGAVGLGEACVVVAGASGAGKSTLSVAAQLDGLDVLGDDSAPVLRDSGRVAAVPLATMLREGSWGLFAGLADRYCLSEIHERETGRVRFLTPRAAVPLHSRRPVALLFVCRAAGAAPALVPLGMVETLSRLGESGFWVRSEHDAVSTWLTWLEMLPRYAMYFDTPAEGVALLRGLLSA